MNEMKMVLGTMTFGGQVDADLAGNMIAAFEEAGGVEIDTANSYQGGESEIILASKAPASNPKLKVATKIGPWSKGRFTKTGLEDNLKASLERLGRDSIDLYYLHAPDYQTLIEQALEAMASFIDTGKIKRFGLSNYASWQVAGICEICRAHQWPQPTVYQGMYNAITRHVDSELFNCLNAYGISFHAYNPLAGGLLTGKYKTFGTEPTEGRFKEFEFYKPRYWQDGYFAALDTFVQACKSENVAPADAALRWMSHHSKLRADKGDGIIIGATSLAQLEANMKSCKSGPLSDAIVNSIDAAWEKAQPICPSYFK